MPSLSSESVHKHWRYTLDHEFQAVLPGGELGEAAKWAAGSPHDSKSSILNRFVPFEKPIEQWNSWSVNADNSMLAVSSSRGFEENTGVILVDLTPDPTGDTTSASIQTPSSQSVFGRLGSYVFGSSSKGHRTKSKIRHITGFFGRLGSLVFSPTDPSLLIIGAEPSYRGDGAAVKDTLFFWDASSTDDTAQRMPEDVLEASATQAIDTMAKDLKKHHPGTRKSLTFTTEDRKMLQESILKDLHQIDFASSTKGFTQVFGRLATSFGSVPFSSDGTKVLYMPGASPVSNGEDDGWKVAIYDITSKKTTATLKGHTDAIMWTGFSPSGKWILTVAWDKTIRLWTSDGKEKWVWKTKGQNWTGVFSPDESYVVATCGDGTIFAWSIESGEELWRYRGAFNQRRWMRSLAFSPDGHYLAFGSDEGGRVSLIDLHAPLSDDGKREVLTYRELGAEGVKRPADDDDDDDDVPEKHRQTPEQKEKFWKIMVKGMISTRDVSFLKMDQPGYATSTKTDYLVGYSNGIDRGLEIYDMEKNEKWRVQVVTDKRSPRTGDEQSIEPQTNTTSDETEEKNAKGGPFKFRGVYDGLLGWKYLPRSEEVMTIHSDGVRFWHYE